MNLVKVHVGVDVVRRRHDLHQAGVHVLRVGAVEGAGPLPPHGLVRVRHDDDDDRDGPLAVARGVEHQVERGVEVVRSLLETNLPTMYRLKVNEKLSFIWSKASKG